MQIGISSPAFSNDDFEMRLESIVGKFELWEIVADLSHSLPTIRDKFTELAPSYDLKYAIHAPFNDLNIAGFNDTMRRISRETIKECMKVASELDLKEITMHPGHYCPAGMYAPEKVNELSREGVHELAEYGSELGIKISLENMPIPNWTLCTTRDELVSYIEGTDMAICFDIGHAHINSQIFEMMEEKNRFGNVHVHDNNGKRDLHRIIGTGSVPFDKFMGELVSSYSGNIIIEANNLEEGIESCEALKKIIDGFD
jgi:sugar phosphate isomerase/epimerase